MFGIVYVLRVKHTTVNRLAAFRSFVFPQISVRKREPWAHYIASISRYLTSIQRYKSVHIFFSPDSLLFCSDNCINSVFRGIKQVFFFFFKIFFAAFAFIFPFLDRTAWEETGKGGERWRKTCGTFRRFRSWTGEPPGGLRSPDRVLLA